MSTFDNLWTELVSAIGGLATGALKNYKDQVLKDGQAFTDKLKTDLQTWSKQLVNGDIDKDQFEFLVKGKKDIAELLALKQAGLAKVALDQFLDDLVNVIVSTISKVIL